MASTGVLEGSKVVSGASSQVAANEAPTATVTISGTAHVGEVLTGSYVYSDVESDPQGETTFQWYRGSKADGSDKEAIEGATSAQYTLTSADVNFYLFFEVTPKAQTGTLTGLPVVSAPSGEVNAAPTATAVSISGTTKVGEKLTGVYTYGDVNGDLEGTSRFQWYRGSKTDGTDKVAITGANALEYTLTDADLGKYLFFEVTPVDSTGVLEGSKVVSAASAQVVGETINAAPVAINVGIAGTAKEGAILTGSYQYSDEDGDEEGNSVIQWYRSSSNDGSGKEAILGAATGTYTLTADDIGKYIYFEVTPVAKTGVTTGTSVLSLATAQVAAETVNTAPTAINVSIRGTAKEGEILTGSYQYSDADGDEEGNSVIQWYRSSSNDGSGKEAIVGATASTYILTAEDIGKYFYFEVTPVAKTGVTTGMPVLSSPTAQVVARAENAAPTAINVTITGIAKEGEVLTGIYQYTDSDGDEEGTSIIQWYRSESNDGLGREAIAEAISSTYTLTAEDIGKYIFFEVTPIAKTGIPTGTAALSQATAQVAPAEAANVAPTAINVNITGIAKEGETLTGSYQYSDVDGDEEGSSVIRWYRSSDNNGTGKEVIVGATSSVYTLTAEDIGKYIFFEVTPIAKTGVTTGSSVLSQATAQVVAETNAAPIARNVSFRGILREGQTLVGSYIYSDAENNVEGNSTYQWYRADSATGAKTLIAGANSITYVLTAADMDKYLFFEVIPTANTGKKTGIAVLSSTVTFSSELRNVISDNTPVLKGKTEANSYVHLKIDNGEAIGFLADKYGNWAYIPTEPLINGDHTITVTVKNLQNHTASISETIKIQTQRQEADILLVAEPASIVGDGRSKTKLKAVVKRKDGTPVAGITVFFSAEAGTLEQTQAITNDKGEAFINLIAPKIESIYPETRFITARVNDIEKNLIAEEQLKVTFLPASIEGVIRYDGKVVANATVTVAEDFDGDGVVDFYNVVTTDENGHYQMPVPKSNHVYTPKIQIPITINGTTMVLERTQQAEVGTITGTGDNVKSEIKFTGQLFVKNEQGRAVLLDAIKDDNGNTPKLNIKVKKKNTDGTYSNDSEVDVITPSSDGAFELEDLEKNQEYMVIISLEVPDPLDPSKKVILAGQTMKVIITEDGEMSVGTQLIDPYGTITDSVTGRPISDVKVTLYWADTVNNAGQDRPVINQAVILPLLPDFPPNNNANPQISDLNGFYAWMVYGNGDYYIVAEKDGYLKYDSRYDDKNPDILIGSDSWIKNGIIHVGETIVPYSFSLNKIISNGPSYMDTSTYISFTGTGTNVTDVTPYITGKGEADSTVAISVDQVQMGVVQVLDNGEWNYNVEKELAKGNHEVKATITDRFGNKSTVTKTITIKEHSMLTVKKQVPYLIADGKSKTRISVQFLTESGSPLRNKEVVLKSEYGTLSVTKGITDQNGFVTVEYTAPLLGDNFTKADSIMATVRNGENFLSFNAASKILLVSKNLKVKEHYSYIRGYKDGTFGPTKLTSRGEVAAMISRMLYRDEPNKVVKQYFKDVSKNSWAFKYVQIATESLIMGGYGDNFRPNDHITRAELAAVVARYLKLKIVSGSSYTDIKGHWAEDEIIAVTKLGLMSATGKKFNPNAPVTRAEIVTVFNAMLGRGPLENPLESPWKDVSINHPSYWQIEEASRSHLSIFIREKEEKWYEEIDYLPW